MAPNQDGADANLIGRIGAILGLLTAVTTLITAIIGAYATHLPDQKPTVINDIKLGVQVIASSVLGSGTTPATSAPVVAQLPPKATAQSAPITVASPKVEPPEQDASVPCAGLDPEKLKIEKATVDGIGTGAQKSYSVDLTVRNVSKQLVWLMYVDPVQLIDDQKNHIPLQTTWLKLGLPRTDEGGARAVLAYGLKMDSSLPTPSILGSGLLINFLRQFLLVFL